MRKALLWTTTIVVLLLMAYGAVTLVNTSVEIVKVSSQRLSQEEVEERQDDARLYDRKMVQETFSKDRPAWTKVLALVIALVAIPLIPIACVLYTMWSIANLLPTKGKKRPRDGAHQKEPIPFDEN